MRSGVFARATRWLRPAVLILAVLSGMATPLSPLTPQAVVADSSVTVEPVSGTFYPYSGTGPFDPSQLSSPAFTQQFPVVDFNPTTAAQTFCSNSTGINEFTRPFTDVVPNADGTCGTQVVQGNGQQAGNNPLYQFEASFLGSIVVGSAGKVTFNMFSDDGWILGLGPVSGGAAQPSYISGAMANPPSSTPVDGYAVVGALNQGNTADTNQVSVYFPAAGTYPMELDYTECCGGQLALTLGTTAVTPWLQISPQALPAATQTQSGYSQSLSAAGATGTITWSLQSGATLPAGLTLSAGGVISGTVSATATSSTFAVVATDASGTTGSRQYTLTVNPPPQVTTTTLGSAIQGQSGYAQSLAASGGTAPLTWSLQSGSLPAGLTLSPSGVISGDVSASAGSSTFTVLVTDANGVSASAPLSITVGPSPNMLGPDLFGFYSPGAAATQPCTQGDPVNCDTGNLVEQVTDLQVGGRGRSLDLTRTYNALDATGSSSPHRLGYGWSDSYGMSLGFVSTTTPTQAVVHSENGSTVRFHAVNGGGWAPVGPWVIAKLVANANGTYTYTLPDQTTDVFNAAGVLVAEGDRDGYTTTLGYNAAGQLTTVTDPAGRALTFTYGANGLVSTASDPLARVVHYGYDAAGDLTSVTDPAGSITTFGYDALHRLTTVTRPVGGVTTNVFDTANRVTSQTDPLGHTTTFAYAAGTTTITDPTGSVTVETYQNNLLTNLTKGSGTPQQATWTYGYDTAGERISVTDPNGFTSTATYDGSGNLLTSTNGVHSTTTYTYDSLNDLTSVTDPNNHVVTIARDGVGHPLSVSQVHTEDGKVAATTYTYGDPAHPGDITAETDPDGHTTVLTYNAAGDLIGSKDALGNLTTYGYNAIGWLTSQTSPLGNSSGSVPAQYTATLSYDGVGDVLTSSDALGDTTTNVYDADHDLIKVTDANGHVTKYVYDLAGRQTEVDQADGVVTKTSYTAAGKTATQTDGLGRVTSYTYDPLQRIATQIDPLKRTTTYAYDGAGNETTLTDPQGRTTSMFYDGANELTNVDYSDGVTPNVTYGYDNAGNRLTMTDGTGTSTYQYDSLGRLVQSVNGAGDVVGYGYTLAGRLATIAYPTGVATASVSGQGLASSGTVTRAYNAAGEVSSITDWLGNITSFGYDADGNLTIETLPNGVSSAMTYDQADRLTLSTATGPQGVSLLNLPYTRDAVGQLTSANPLATSPAVTQAYGYDASNRLLTSAIPAPGGLASVPNSTYSYDSANNLTSSTTGAVTTTLGYDTANELLSTSNATGSSAYTYDAQGNRVTRTGSQGGISTYGYDQADRLTSYIGPAVNQANAEIQYVGGQLGAGLNPSFIQIDYKYNGDGLRMAKAVSTTNVINEAWDVAEGQPLLIQDGLTNYVTDPSGLPLEQIQPNGTALFYLHDQLGSTRMLTDSHGLPVATYAYDAYGNSVGTLPAVANPFQYAGQYKDVESGLYYLRARYYDPSTGQFLSRDPLSALTHSPYGYVGANPLNGVDSSGLLSIPLGGTWCLQVPLTDSSGCNTVGIPNCVTNPWGGPSSCQPLLTPSDAGAIFRQLLTGSSCPVGLGSVQASDLSGLSKGQINALKRASGQRIEDIKGEVVGDNQVKLYNLGLDDDGYVWVARSGSGGRGYVGEPQPTGWRIQGTTVSEGFPPEFLAPTDDFEPLP